MKKKILYITNKEVPYKTNFFNELAKKCELKVIFQSINSNNRNEKWAKSVCNNFQYVLVDEDKYGKIFPLIKTLWLIKGYDYDYIIFGCINNKIQLLIMTLFRILRKKYYLNLDGECFITPKNFKDKIKKFFIKGAEKYFVAGEKSAQSITKFVTKDVIPYYFSSLLNKDISNRKKEIVSIDEKENFILVVGQYVEYKGLDIAVKVAKRMPNYKFKFVGMGSKTDEFKKFVENFELENIEIIPFLQQEELNNEYRKCKMLVLPSRKECWGLVINEAASFGCPIVSTVGCGAAVEFLEDEYPQFLANIDDEDDLYNKIICLDRFKDKEKYSSFLIKKSQLYYIEKCADIHLENLTK